jgi:hypothetical protein
MKTTKHFLAAAAFAALALFACSGDSDGDNFTDGSSSSVGDGNSSSSVGDSSSSIEGNSSSSVENSSSSALADGIYLDNVLTTWDEAFASIRAGGSGTETTPKTYTISVYGTHDVPGIGMLLYSNQGFGPDNEYVTVTLNGKGKLYLNSQGAIINLGNRQTLIIDSANLVLEGLKSGQNGATENNNRAIIEGINATVELKNGTITDNSHRGISLSGTLKISGGKIANNTSGGVTFSGTFTMSGGEISDNTVNGSGGGVSLSGNTTFTMTGGKISGNQTNLDGGYSGSGCGGGVYLSDSSPSPTFTMSGGEISGNKATFGGGVYLLGNYGTVIKQAGGIIYGNDGTDKQNTASKVGGHAVAGGVNSYEKYRSLTLGVDDTFDSRDDDWN